MAEGGQRPQVNLSCSVCLEEFKTPKVLSCGHTYCLRCVDRLVERNGPIISLQCPICRTHVSFPASGRTEDLITNFQLLSMINNHQGNGQSDIPVETNPVEALSQSECPVHGVENKLYCQSCKVPVCVNCTLAEHDVDSHTIVSKKNFVKEQKKQVEELTKKLPKLRTTYAELAKIIDGQKEEYIERGSKLEREVQYILAMRQRQLAEEASNLLRVIKEYQNEPEQKNQEFCNQLAFQNSLLERTETEARNVKEDLDAQRFTNVNKVNELAGKTAKIEQELESIRRDFHSVPNKPILAFQPTNTKEKLGYLVHQTAGLVAPKQPVKLTSFGRFPQTRLAGHLMPTLQGRLQPTTRPVPHSTVYLSNQFLGGYNPQFQPYEASNSSGSEISFNSYGQVPNQRVVPDTWHILPGNENWILKADETWSNSALSPNSGLPNPSDFT